MTEKSNVSNAAAVVADLKERYEIGKKREEVILKHETKKGVLGEKAFDELAKTHGKEMKDVDARRILLSYPPEVVAVEEDRKKILSRAQFGPKEINAYGEQEAAEDKKVSPIQVLSGKIMDLALAEKLNDPDIEEKKRETQEVATALIGELPENKRTEYLEQFAKYGVVVKFDPAKQTSDQEK